MTEKEFYKLLCEMVKQDHTIDNVRMLELLSMTKLKCEKTDRFAGKPFPWDSMCENIYLITTPENIPELLEHKDYLRKKLEQIYPVGDDYQYAFCGFEIKPGKIEPDENVSQDIFFENIEKQIIEEIKKAKYLIWVAMAWFTNRNIYDELVNKKKQGVNIRIVIDDNIQNSKAPFRLEDEFETSRINIQSFYKNIMHDKFCIIDLHTVIHGSFNWTNAANYNKETISVDSNTATAKKFADEFIKLKTYK